MKIKITNAEAAEICRVHLERALGKALDVEMEGATATFPSGAKIESYTGNVIVNISEAIFLVRSFDYRGSQRIASIKALREWGVNNGLYISLGEAKKFVEGI